MRTAIISLLHTAAALMAQEVADAQASGNLSEMAVMTAARNALIAVIASLTAKTDDEVTVALTKAQDVLKERVKVEKS